MCRSRSATSIILALGLLLITVDISTAEETRYGLGQPATDADIKAWDIDISPNGAGLPPGRGTVQQGAIIYVNKCAACHGPTGIEGPKDRLAGGQGSLATGHPIKTIGSYWPYATTLYDYIFRAMPFTAPQSLTPNEVYAIVAWLLHRNGIVGADTILDARTLPTITMPNHSHFVPDSRPDVGR